jgi:hypothetical protein
VLSRILWEVTNSSPSDSEGICIPTESPSVIDRTPSLRVDRYTPLAPQIGLPLGGHLELQKACNRPISNCNFVAISVISAI